LKGPAQMSKVHLNRMAICVLTSNYSSKGSKILCPSLLVYWEEFTIGKIMSKAS
jgi:hypothetical protein